jgi:oxygen-independent coproporphyrinogen-3 oxidase
VFFDERRWATAALKDPAAWARQTDSQGHGLADETPLSRSAEGEEALLMGLRLSEGVELDVVEGLLGAPLNPDALHDLSREGLLDAGGGRIRATPRGRLVLNAVIAALAPG